MRRSLLLGKIVKASLHSFGRTIRLRRDETLPVPKMHRKTTLRGRDRRDQGEIPYFDVSRECDKEGMWTQVAVCEVGRGVEKVEGPDDALEPPSDLFGRRMRGEPSFERNAGFRDDDQVPRLLGGVAGGDCSRCRLGGMIGIERCLHLQDLRVPQSLALLKVVQRWLQLRLLRALGGVDGRLEQLRLLRDEDRDATAVGLLRPFVQRPAAIAVDLVPDRVR